MQLQLEDLYRGFYLEDYHVAPFHPGLGNFVTCDDLTWQFGDWYSVQRVGVTSLTRPGSSAYERWHKMVLDYHDGQLPAHGAIWLTYPQRDGGVVSPRVGCEHIDSAG